MTATPRRAIGVLAALAIVALLAAPKVIQLRRADSPHDDASSENILKVRVHRVVPTQLTERLATTGTLRANERVEIVSEISGKISAILFEEGSRVAAGELLLKIDDTELAAERLRAVHEVELAERNEARQNKLLQDGVISNENHDVALGELNVLRAELQLIEATLLKTEIRAPFGGIIGLRWVSPGSYLSSATTIASLNDVDPVKLDLTVPEKYSTLMRVGSEISFAVDGFERSFVGTIYAIEPSVDPSTRSLRMRATCPNRDGALVPGMFANVDLVVRSESNALAVPSIAVIPELGGKKVFVYEGGRAQPRAVETGIRTESAIQITSGVGEGDLVITSGLFLLQPGLEVQLEEPVAADDPVS